MTMTWQSGRQLASINKDGLSATFAYDANGHRTQKTVNGVTTNYYWVGDRLQYLAIGDDMYVFFYDDKGTPYGVFTLIDGVQEHLFYLYNAQGDVIAIIDDYAERVVNYEYSAWGELLSVTGSKADTVGTLNPFRYRGYCYDTETGFYYLNSRYYDPVTQRFVNGDGEISGVGNSIQGYNLFAYCFNNPICMDDADGNWPKWLKYAACALAVAAVALTVAVATPVLVTAGAVTAAVGTTISTVATATYITASLVSVSYSTAELVKNVVENTKYSGPVRDQSVYVMRDKSSNDVQYVGRSNNPARRQKEHAKDPTKANLKELEVVFSGLTKSEARAMKQILISTYSLENLVNARREIATGKVSKFAHKIGNVIKLFGSSVEDEYLNLMGR